MVSLEVARTLSEMKPGTHAVLIYDSAENRRDILMTHMRLGVHDARLAYVCSDESPEQVESWMRGADIEVDNLRRENRLAIDRGDDVYFKDGRPDIPSIIGYFSFLAFGSKWQGLNGGVRIAGDMTGFIRRKMVPDLETLERRLHRTFEFPAIGLWAYDLTELSNSGHLESLLRLLHSQNPVIFAGPRGASVLMPDTTRAAIPSQQVRAK
ncbi:MAG TPA: MEDS domain-containing protein [Nitrososphaerales archaeon]|nr:MEDS domain-containing protein [Nitrososphaerales archaeon]